MFAHPLVIFNNSILREAVEGPGQGSLLMAVLIFLYGAILLTFSIYGGHRYSLIVKYLRSRRRQPVAPRSYADSELPGITVQLPLFNEMYVVDRLLDAVGRMDYPRDRIEVQVLDDSTDETVTIAEAAVRRWRAEGLDVVYVNRGSRKGFKAGALEYGLGRAKFDLVAVFDADFTPPPGYLRSLVDHFTDPGVGMVQGRWGHLNREHSLLTRVQALMLDGHFLVEHPARNRNGLFFNFNGTGGIWRRAAIEDAGGWHHETLTEDLDLSYRSQMAGWRFVYRPDVICPAELPVEMNAFKTQQHRWAKGSIQVMRKILPTVLRADLPWRIRLEAFLHLTSNLCYPLMIVMCVMTLPMLVVRARIADGQLGTFIDAGILICATLSVIVFYSFAQMVGYRDWWRRILLVPVMLAVGIGLAVNQARAVMEALLGHESAFVRTPKYNLGASREGRSSWLGKRYRGLRTLVPWIEITFAVYYTLICGYAIQQQLWTTLPFLLLFFAGFWYVGLSSLLQGRRRHAPAPSALPARA